MTSIFGTYAPLYWAKGISVIPLRVQEKKPMFFDWTKWQSQLPSPEMQAQWADTFEHNNMGLVLGPQSNMTAIDIDTEDENVRKAIMSVLPHSPWTRVGQKGCVMLYKWNGRGTIRILDENRKTVVEIISAGGQIVLPPSIHPNTKQPYVANADLLEVYDQLVMLPNDIEMQLREAVSPFVKLYSSNAKFRYSEKVSFGGRDISMTKHAGAAATMVIRGELSLLRAMDNMRVWYDANVEKKEGDELDIEKGLRMIVQFLISDINQKNLILPTGWDEGLSDEQKKDWGLLFNDDQEEWTVEQLEAHVYAHFQKFPEGSPARYDCIEFVLNKLAKSVNLNSIDIERVMVVVQKGTKMKMGALNKRLKELKVGKVAGTNHTEIAEATIAEFERKGYMLRSYGKGFWTWNGTHWEEFDTSEVWSFIAKEFGELPAAAKASDHNGIIKVMGNILPKKIKVMDVQGVNFKNGFLTQDMKLLTHSPDFGMTYTLPFNYSPELAGKAFRFEQFLKECWSHNPDCADKIRATYEAISVTLFGVAPMFQRAFLLHGVGGSGKSQLLDVISHIVPPDAKCAMSPDMWDDDNHKAHLHNKLLNIAGELSKEKKLPDKVFKEVVSGEEIQARTVYEKSFSYRPKAAHWFASNFLPKSRDTSNGFNRRWLIIDFDRVVPEDKKIPNLGNIIADEEIEAIVATSLSIYPEFLKRGSYTIPDSHKYLTKEMALANSVVRQWLEARVVMAEGTDVKEMELYKDFWGYCAGQLASRVMVQKQWYLDTVQFLAEQGISNTKTENGEVIFTNMKLKK